MKLGLPELLVVLAIVLVVGGYKVIPKIAKSIKDSVNVFKDTEGAD